MIVRQRADCFLFVCVCVCLAVGVGRPHWMAGRLQGDSGSEDNSSMTIDSSLKKEATERPSTPAHWDRSAPVSRYRNIL